MPTLEEIDSLSYDEKVSASEKLQISLSKNPEDQVPTPEWHKEILAKRLEKIESGEAEWISLEEAREQSLAKYRK